MPSGSEQRSDCSLWFVAGLHSLKRKLHVELYATGTSRSADRCHGTTSQHKLYAIHELSGLPDNVGDIVKGPCDAKTGKSTQPQDSAALAALVASGEEAATKAQTSRDGSGSSST